MGDFIPEVEEGNATVEKVSDVYDKLESLIRCQLAEDKPVGDVLIAFGPLLFQLECWMLEKSQRQHLDLQDPRVRQ
jgi:hypothetical protein